MLASRPFSRRTLVAERMAMVSLRIRAALLMGLLASLPQPAQAQSSPQSIFGYGFRAPHSPYRLAPGGFFSPTRPGWDEPAQHPEMVTTYRTLCVRMCDGYYFPISSAATQDTLMHDADACSASCGTEARLFFHPSTGGDDGQRRRPDGHGLQRASPTRSSTARPWSRGLPMPAAAVVRGGARAPPRLCTRKIAGRCRRRGCWTQECRGDCRRRLFAPERRAGGRRSRRAPAPVRSPANIEPILPRAVPLRRRRLGDSRGPLTAGPYGRRY